MASRISVSTLRELVAELSRLTGAELQIDRTAQGYQLQQVITESGTVRDDVLGLSWGHRLPAREMYQYLSGLAAGIYYEQSDERILDEVQHG